MATILAGADNDNEVSYINTDYTSSQSEGNTNLELCIHMPMLRVSMEK